MGDLVLIVAIAGVAGAIGLGIGIVLSRTAMRRIADGTRDAGDQEEEQA